MSKIAEVISNKHGVIVILEDGVKVKIILQDGCVQVALEDVDYKKPLVVSSNGQFTPANFNHYLEIEYKPKTY